MSSIKSILAAFNSETGTPVKTDAGERMVALADAKSAYGRAVRDITAVALSGRWIDESGAVMSDNAIGHAMGIAMRQPRARLNALALSGLTFESDADIKANADVWAHVAKMYNAGKAGRDALVQAAEMIKAIVSVDDKRAAWLDTLIPSRTGESLSRSARPDDGGTVSAPVETDATPAGGALPTDTAEKFSVRESETSTLLSHFQQIGAELSDRFADMSVAERGMFMEHVAILADTTAYAVKATAKK